jgi:superfamily II DNA or RNA helicase
VVVRELVTEDVLDQARIDMHTAPLVLATYLTASSGWVDVTHWGAIVLGSQLGCQWQVEQFIGWLLRPAPRKETAVMVDIEDRHPTAYHRLCRRVEVYTRLQMPWCKIA